MLLLALLALVGDPQPSEAAQRISDMATLYEQVCLKAFPDDKIVETLMKAQSARELTSDEVKVTMGDDPARGWELKDNSTTVWLEFPPFHACSVRFSIPSNGDLSVYRSIVDKYEGALGGFAPIETFERDQGAIHIHAVGERRTLPSRGIESLFVIDQYISDAKRREAGETGVVLRFVHQLTQPPTDVSK